MMNRKIQILLYLPISALTLILLFSWTFYGELFLSFLPYVLGLYSIFLFLVTLYLSIIRVQLKNINIYWVNWIIVFCLFLGIFSYYFGLEAHAVEDSDSNIKIISSNLWYKNANLPEMEDFLEKENADILMLTEFSDFHYEYLNEFLTSNYPYKIVNFNGIDKVPYTGKAIFSKYPLTENKLPESEYANLFLSGTTTVEGRDLDLLLVHTTAPVDIGHFNSRNKQLIYLRDIVENQTGIISGDFNTSPWSPRFLLLDRDFNRNSFEKVRSNRFDFSWYFQTIPFFKSKIDHTFTSEGIHVNSYELKQMPGSDHKAQLYTVTIN